MTLLQLQRGGSRRAAVTVVGDPHAALVLLLSCCGLLLDQERGTTLPLRTACLAALFALSGSAMARGLTETQPNPWPVLRRHLCQLLLPFWACVAVLRWQGSGVPGTADGTDLAVWEAVLPWVLPFWPAPGFPVAEGMMAPLALVPACAWLIVLSPALRWFFRRWPLGTLTVPACAVLAAGAGVWPAAGGSEQVLLALAVFGPCWLLGFARHDGRLHAVHPLVLTVAAAVLITLGALGYAGQPGASASLAEAATAGGVVLMVLRAGPRGAVVTGPAWLLRFERRAVMHPVPLCLWAGAVGSAMTWWG